MALLKASLHHFFLVGLEFPDFSGEFPVGLLDLVEFVENLLHPVIRVVVDEEVGEGAGQHPDDPDSDDHQEDCGELADEGVWGDVPVTDRGCRGDGPPQRPTVGNVFTYRIHRGSDDQNADTGVNDVDQTVSVEEAVQFSGQPDQPQQTENLEEPRQPT